MKCALCGYEFKVNESEVACRGCLFVRSCNLVRCPNCGYESPLEPKLMKVFKKWRKKKDEDK